MPTVPTLQNQVSPQAAPNVQRRPLQVTGPESIAHGVAGASGVLFKIRNEEQQKADQAAFMDADRTTDAIANDLYTQAQSKQMKDAIGIGPQSMSEFDKRTSEIENNLKNDRQKTAYRNAVNNRRSQLQRQIDNHEGQQREAYYAKSREDYKDQAHLNAVTNYQDPKAIDGEIDKIRAAVDQTPGLDAEQKATELGVRRSGVYEGVIDRYLSNDQVGAAEKYYNSIRDKVNGDKASNIERGILAAKKRLEAEQKAKLTEVRQSLTDQLQDINAAAQAGIPITQVPPRAMLELVFGKYEGGQKYEAAQKMANLSMEVGALHDLPADDLYNQATQYKPIQVQGAADAAQVQAFMAGRVQRILEERKADPAGYLVQHSPAVNQAWDAFEQAGDDVSRAAYLKAVRAERERLQIPGDDVLPNAYVQQVADQINTADAQKLASVIERESQKWGADWPAVQGQLAGKISDSAAVISSGIPRGAAVQLAATAHLKQNELAALLPPGTSWDSMRDAVKKQFEQFDASLPSEATSTVAAFQDSAIRLSVQYMHQGMSQSNAVQKAYTDLVRDQIVEFRSAPYRVPPDQDKALIDTGARSAVENFTPPAGSVYGAAVQTSTDAVMRGLHVTTLNQDQETAYRQWLSKIGMTREAGYNLDGNFTGRDYDLRGFFKKYGPVDVNVKGGQHFTDEFKLPNHATFSDQSVYATGAARALAGHWEGDTYVPPARTGGAFTAEEYASQLREHVRENGYWVTRPDAKGLRLYVDGGPVAGIDGPVQYTWEQLRGFADKAAQAAYEAQAKIVRERQERR